MREWMPYAVAGLSFVCTALGGWAALRLRHRLHPVMAFAAGVVVATALADLLPESMELLGHAHALAGMLAVCGYLGFSALEAQLHRHAWEHQHDPHTDDGVAHEHAASPFTLIGAAWLIVHSLIDGMAIGTGFRVNESVGLVVTLAVLAHDFADGMNVAILTLASRSRGKAAAMVLLDAVAPVVGAVIALRIAAPPEVLGGVLAVFAGAFIALGAGHLLPEVQHKKPGAAPGHVLLAGAGALIVLGIRHAIGD